MLAQLVKYYLSYARSAFPGINTSEYTIPASPLFTGNEVANTICTTGDELHALHSRPTQGWTWTDAEDKPGFICQLPGSELVLPLQLAKTHTQAMSLGLAYLRSYHDVGIFEVSCQGSCQCASTKVDCYHDIRTSQQFFVYFDITLSESIGQSKCAIHILVSETTSSGGNFIKISGLTLEEGHQGKFSSSVDRGIWGAVRQDND